MTYAQPLLRNNMQSFDIALIIRAYYCVARASSCPCGRMIAIYHGRKISIRERITRRSTDMGDHEATQTRSHPSNSIDTLISRIVHLSQAIDSAAFRAYPLVISKLAQSAKT
jgi:hypothetical protein